MKKLINNILTLFIAGLFIASCNNPKPAESKMPETKYGWEFGAVSYNFKNFTFLEALDKIDSCGLRYVEGFPQHKLGGDLEGTLDYHMDESMRAKVLEILKEKDIKLLTYGVVSPTSEEEWRTLFEFGKAMGIRTFSSEPDEKFLPLVSQLCDEFQINIAIHNHSFPTHYWHPDTVLNTISGHSERIGACVDIGHWIESGLDPVEGLKKLEGRILHFHMADLNDKGEEGHSVPWGKGVVDFNGIFAELERQHYNGSISFEYEYNWNNSVPDITESVHFIRDLLSNQ